MVLPLATGGQAVTRSVNLLIVALAPFKGLQKGSSWQQTVVIARNRYTIRGESAMADDSSGLNDEYRN
jgi:hypothetical protein